MLIDANSCYLLIAYKTLWETRGSQEELFMRDYPTGDVVLVGPPDQL